MSAVLRHGNGASSAQLLLIELGAEFQWPLSEFETSVRNAAAVTGESLSAVCRGLLEFCHATGAETRAVHDIADRERARICAAVREIGRRAAARGWSPLNGGDR